MIFDLSTSDIAQIRRLMREGAKTEAELTLAEVLPTTIARALGEHDYMATELQAWKDAFFAYGREIDRILARPALDRPGHERETRMPG